MNEFELADGSYLIPDIQDYFEYIKKKKDTENIDNPSIRKYINKIENRIIFKIKTGCYLELLTSERKLLGSTESKITKDKIGENVPRLEIIEVVLLHCNIASSDCQQDSRVLYIFVPNRPFGSLLKISPKNHIFIKTFNSDQNSQPLEIEDKINLALKIK